MVKSAEKMGRRKLAYTVRKCAEGHYVLLTLEANGPVVLELERRLRVSEQVIKFLTVRMDEEVKRLAKAKANRGVRRKTGPEAAAEAARFLPRPRLRLRSQLRLGCRSDRACTSERLKHDEVPAPLL